MAPVVSNISLKTELNDDSLKLEIDVALIDQVLINLINNSLTALAEGASPEILLKAYTDEGKTIIQVTDNGSGIPEERLEDIFMPFYTTSEKGSGIGLSFVRQIMRLHNAEVSVNSDFGKGTSFYLKF